MKNKIFGISLVLVLALILSTAPARAYNLQLNLDQYGNLYYSFPLVLGDDDKVEVKEEKEERKEERKEEKKEEKVERKEVKQEKIEAREVKRPEIQKQVPRITNPATIKLKKSENEGQKVELKRGSEKEELHPSTLNLEIPSAPKNLSIPKPSKIELPDDDKNEIEDENEVENEIENEVGDDSDDANTPNPGVADVLKERNLRTREKIQFQSEVHDDGTVEYQLESRDIKAKIKSNELEIDVTNNNIGVVNSEGTSTPLVHLPDQVLTKLTELGITPIENSLEISQEGNTVVYKSKTTKSKNLLGFIPRKIDYEVTLEDSTGQISEQATDNSILSRFLDFLSY